jgi:hypothetical protein
MNASRTADSAIAVRVSNRSYFMAKAKRKIVLQQVGDTYIVKQLANTVDVNIGDEFIKTGVEDLIAEGFEIVVDGKR